MKKIILFLVLFLTACGFHPMYSYDSSENIQTKTESIFVKPIVGVYGIEMRNYLRTLLNPYGDPKTNKYELIVNLHTNEIYKGIQKTGDATWIDIQVYADYELKNLETKEVLFKGNDSASESYPVVQDLIAATSSKETATRNAIRVLSENIGIKVQAIMENEVENK